jgi:class 3 adenylate cyclase
MVVSGVPDTNNGRHIVEICNMALNLREEIVRFKIRHLPDHQVQLRVGIHTGPCAAGKLSLCVKLGLNLPHFEAPYTTQIVNVL